MHYRHTVRGSHRLLGHSANDAGRGEAENSWIGGEDFFYSNWKVEFTSNESLD